MVLQKKLKLFKNQKGLTLIELLAVVVILGIIAAIAVPAIQGTIESQKTKADAQTRNVIEDAALRYVYDVAPDGKSPETKDGISESSGTSDYEVDVATLGAKGYLSSSSQPLQADTEAYFDTVEVSFSNTTGWTVDGVSTATN